MTVSVSAAWEASNSPVRRMRAVIKNWSSISLKQLVRAHARAFRKIAFISGAVFAVTFGFPLTIQRTIDMAASHRGWHLVLCGIALAIVFLCAEAYLTHIRQAEMMKLGVALERRIDRRLFLQLMRINRLNDRQYSTADLHRCFHGVVKVRDFLTHQLAAITLNTIVAIAAVVLTFAFDAVMGCAALVMIIAVGAWGLLPGAELRTEVAAYQSAAGRRQSALSDSLMHRDEVRMHGMEYLSLNNWMTLSSEMFSRMLAFVEISTRASTQMQALGRLVVLGVLALGCWRIAEGRLSFGELIAIQMLVSRATVGLMTGGDFLKGAVDAGLAAAHISDFLATRRETYGAIASARAMVSGKIVANNLTVSYDDGGTYALRGLCLALPSTGVIAVVGRNGSGKSTLMKVLTGALPNYEGSVSLGDVKMGDIHPRHYRRQIGIVDQDAAMFPGTIRRNVSTKPLQDKEIYSALTFSTLDEFVKALPAGLDTRLGPGNMTLSGGQRQRLAIARAVARNPRYAFFDEPSSFLDSHAAVDLERRIVSWGVDRLVVIVTHNLGIARAASSIIVLDAGEIVGYGRHSELLAGCSSYSALWRDYVDVHGFNDANSVDLSRMGDVNGRKAARD